MLVSICIPCHNAQPYLAETLSCLINQSHKNLEIIVVDDHSKDESVKIIQEFAEKDQRIRFETAKSKGAAAARNQACELSKGNFVGFFDADDWIPENFIETQLQTLKTDQEVVVCTWGRFYHNNLSTITIDDSQVKTDLSFEQWILHYWINNSHMTCPGRVLMPRHLIDQSGLWDEDLNLNDDFTFYTRIFSNCSIIRYNPRSVFYYRSGISGLSSTKGSLAYQSLYNSLVRSITSAQSKLKISKELNICYANLLQNFIYETYPYEPKLIKQTEQLIQALGGSNLRFPAGGKSRILASIVGWKLTKRLKNIG
ncbi:glycosyltransferase involved in cell wall biosynthesis [Pedobacter sp. AK013]|uniref:glycosyltransferase family 2 protein n=1 Tax=Pedobacter sp. AK013 TaxID=2723071 RepID=UPI00161C82F9|nr:glycosyltransferase family 2 protein [Pedobacter sp. AK013]MBB6235497.1 glycosyltransferase involved in cell wall biosynthesis [Pedobacter sp. AK013]